MSIATAIMALSPWIYWKLDESAGTVAADSSGHGINGTYSGDLGLGAVGPELNTNALRVFATGQVVSPALSLTAWNSFSVCALVTGPANGSPNPQETVLGISPLADKLVRGFRVRQYSSGNNSIAWYGGGTLRTVNTGVGNNHAHWHWMFWGYDSVANQLWQSIDGTTKDVATVGTPGTVWQATDPLWIYSAAPVVISHVAVFTQSLTQTQLDNIRLEIPVWPYAQPINVPYTVGGEVDLTPVLDQGAATQAILNDPVTGLPQVAINLDAVHDDINGMISTTFPSLQDVLNNITADLQTTIQTATGYVSQSIGDLLSGAFPQAPDARDLSGGETCLPIDVDVGDQPVYSITLTINAYPADWHFSTPDQAWSARDLAVIRFYIGETLVERQGVHTISHQVSPLPGSLYPLVFTPVFRSLPSGYRITVDWADGVCGTLTAANFFG